MKRILFIVIILTLLGSCSRAILNGVNRNIEKSSFITHKGIRYNLSNFQLDLYLPKDKKATVTLVFFYGGCWGHCSNLSKTHYLFVANTFTALGYAVVIADTRQYPDVQFELILHDAKDVVLWSIDNLRKYGVNDSKIFIMGHSSGAHIGAVLVDNEEILGTQLKHIGGFIGLAGPFDFRPFHSAYLYDLFSGYQDNDYHLSQPINYINGNEPPHLILHGQKDKRVSPHNAINTAARLKSNHVQHQIEIINNMSHSKILLSLSKPPEKNAVVTLIKEFIDQYSH